AGVNFKTFADPGFNNAKQIVFSGTVTGPGVVAGTNDHGIWAGTAGALQLVARTGSPAPGAGDGVNFNGIDPPGQPVINGRGQVAFTASMTQNKGRGLWMGTPGNLRLVTATGMQAPDRPAGVKIDGLLYV